MTEKTQFKMQWSDVRAFFKAAAALFGGQQIAADYQRLALAPQPPEPQRAFSFLTKPIDINKALENLVLPGAAISADIKTDLATLPVSEFSEKHAAALRPMAVVLGTRPVLFDARDIASTVPEFRIPDIDPVKASHVYVAFELGGDPEGGKKVEIIDGYKTTDTNGTINASATGSAVAKIRKIDESLKMHRSPLPVAGEGTITAGYDGITACSRHPLWQGNVIEGLQLYQRALHAAVHINMTDTPYNADNMNGNTAAMLVTTAMGQQIPQAIDANGRIVIDGKTRKLPGMKAEDIAALTRTQVNPISSQEMREPTMLELMEQIGTAQRRLYVTQQSAQTRATKLIARMMDKTQQYRSGIRNRLRAAKIPAPA